jgi:hypothetical protein
MNKSTERPVLVTTAHRGVFFGYCADVHAESLALSRARLCIYWSADMEGFMGLAAKGPSASCRIGPPADIQSLRNITGVFSVTPQAEKKWNDAKWSM